MSGREEVPRMAPRQVQENYGFEKESLEDLQAIWKRETAPKWHLQPCVCPDFGDVRGFRQACPVHGGRTREDFARLTALRGEIASRVRAPASARKWGRDAS